MQCFSQSLKVRPIQIYSALLVAILDMWARNKLASLKATLVGNSAQGCYVAKKMAMQMVGGSLTSVWQMVDEEVGNACQATAPSHTAVARFRQQTPLL